MKTVPVLAQIPYSLEEVKQLSNGQATLCKGSHIREGVVVRPLYERTNPKTGRTIFKCLSDVYMLKQSKGEIVDYTDH